MAAVELLELRQDLLLASDIDLIERLLRESRTWALVDGLAASVVGDLVERYPELSETLDRWSTDEDFWIRRSALLALLLPLGRGQGDFERFGRYADAMLEDREFFIRKAIGWVLRDTARKRPDLVFEWLAPRAARASGVTIREAQKHLSAEQQSEIAAARSLGAHSGSEPDAPYADGPVALSDGRAFPEIEDELAWPRRRIASVLGSQCDRLAGVDL